MSSLSLENLNFTAIDFETANSNRASVCSVGLVKVRAGQIVESMHQLVCPPEHFSDFSPRNVEIHGITPELVANTPTWDRVYGLVRAFAGEDDWVAHNAPFDRSVMQESSSIYDLDWPEGYWFDTLRASRELLTLSTYSLPFVASHLGIEEAHHHHAEQDALQAARIAIELARRAGAPTLESLREALASSTLPGRQERTAPGDFSSLEGISPLQGEVVVFTGKLQTVTRKEAQSLVVSLGGSAKGSITKDTTLVVTGDFDPRTFRPGAKLTDKLEKAQRMAEAGIPIEILTEVDFLERIQVTRDALEAATRAQRASTRQNWLPQYVSEQAKNSIAPEGDYWSWLRNALRHPNGTSAGGDLCVRCGSSIDPKSPWQYRERHVCSGDCNEALKRAAKKAWKSQGVSMPPSPTYDPRWNVR
ncbi:MULTISPECIES: exonuclease domain-containing protein [Citricoccus]|uniref:exonuclease domain-containing protein n=1 Tax=Citricoccus TaxID=169133 RepID=UPI000255F273|nr:exonuclease domain-containing protein [Citricoccus sp. CH26A]